MSMAIGPIFAPVRERGFSVRAVTALLFGAQEAGEPVAGPTPEQQAVQRRSGFRLLRGGRGRTEDRPTLTDLYHAHRLGLVRMAVLLVDHQDLAEDVVQEAFTQLYQRHGEELDDLDNALGYLRTAVVNGARSMLRRRKTAREYVPPHETDAPSAEEHAVLNDEHRRVLVALQELTPRQREVLVLRYWSDMSEAQIAETLGLSRGAVKSTASRALDALEKHLEKVR
ncbi:SigE family RNA polymerase sigma factor [Streptomyces sp. SP17BM10]|uniref:RNA polymerase sigma factor n=1 Tax=Streptomyces sp. SP17BM10 TaxID=3002530 RepID=UPI002E78F026|nr:SigE family RNA polymerase sigma factor [Streptomyces sp. SP17BM10]MEE1783916.1 SigE family RNA polymerase sigma factor [Streptomyces sp. SP17BM10]